MRTFVLTLAVLTAGGLVAASSSGSRAGPTLGPVPLIEDSPWTPAEAAGSGLDPTVSIVIRLSDRGRPVSVEVTRVEPPTPYDAAFGQAAREAVLRWRFAPAIRDGRPVESTVERQVRFVPKPPGGSLTRLASRRRPFVLEPRDEEATLWSHFLTLSATEQNALREKLARSGGAYLAPSSLSRASTDRFDVSTDLPSEDAARRIARNLEASFGATYRLLGERVPPQPTRGQVLVFVYSSREALKSLARDAGVSGSFEGFYHPAGVLAFHAELVASELLIHVILHEGVHAFLEAHVVRPGAVLPIWLNEGLADYVANSDIKDGRVMLGSHSKRTTYRNRYVTWRGKSIASADADELRKAMRSGKAPTLATLVAAEPEQFYGESTELYYAEAWMFVHFLRHGRPEWADAAFPRLVLYLAEGFPAAEVFPAVYGAAAADLAEEFVAYVKGF